MLLLPLEWDILQLILVRMDATLEKTILQLPNSFHLFSCQLYSDLCFMQVLF